ncbi:hypothetical protein [Undibacterium luofuense]|uniref:Uncharacterized protein n=1 Tax=Undibacterium luofuense TaxID=2828733 RepID=A0A941I4H6_9BURK|nr:hypothetical protein [Undibacterium luofuense]MBR7781692.1 hypothetical protein [Undibacterium luofuense]
MMKLLRVRNVGPVCIKPFGPLQGGFMEISNCMLLDDCINQQWFSTCQTAIVFIVK